MEDVLKEVLGQVLGTVINPVLEYVDVNGVVQRIDVNEIAQKIDVNPILDKIDMNRLLDRVDVNALLERVDINELMKRSDMGVILAESTCGLFTPVLDAIRTQIITLDLVLMRMARLRVRNSTIASLPPFPGGSTIIESCYPRGRFEKAIAVQGRCNGFSSKASAFFLDAMSITIVFAMFMLIIKLCWILFMGVSITEAKAKVNCENLVIVVFYCICWFLYFWLALLPTGQTFGMLIVGIKLRGYKEDDFTSRQAALRTLVLPLTSTVLPFPLAAIGYFRHDGRMLHDIVAGTCLVYAWTDVQMAKARQKAKNRMEQMQDDDQPSMTSINSRATCQPLQNDGDSDRHSKVDNASCGQKSSYSVEAQASCSKNKND